MRRTVGILVLCAALAPLGCQSNNAQTSSSDINAGKAATPGTTQATLEDQKFFTTAAAAGAYEVEAAQLALQKSSDNQVRTIAQRMVQDHTKANDELAALARSMNVHVAAIPNQQQQGMLDQLQKLQGSDFDREYLRQQRTAHQQAIADFQAATQNTSQPVRAWAAKTLPILREHLAMVNGDMNGMGNMGSNR